MPAPNPPTRRQSPASNRAQVLRPNGTLPARTQPISGRVTVARQGKPTSAIPGRPVSQRIQVTPPVATRNNSQPPRIGQYRTVPTKVLGASALLGQTLQLADGRSFKITSLEVLLPDTAETHAIKKRYGAAADATRVAQRPELVYDQQPLPWESPPFLTTFMRPTNTPAPTTVGPVQPPRPLSPTEKYVGQPLDVGGKHYGGATSLLEANALTHASKTRINNALFRSAQKFNRMASGKVLVPSHVASRGVRLLNATQGAANFSSKFGTKLGVVGAGLSFAKLGYEIGNSKWNAHSFVDGGILAVTITGMVVTVIAGGTAPVWVPIAGAVILLYGIADYAFDLGGQLDQSSWSRYSNRWR